MKTILPTPLYKYRDDSPRTEEIITNQKVYLATAVQLNDPLECKTGQIPEVWKQKNIQEMENAQMAGFATSAIPVLRGTGSFYSLSNRAAKRWLRRWIRLKSRKAKYLEMQSFYKSHGIELSWPTDLFKKFESQLSRVGIFSLSECPDNELMWAHYASSHTGLAIGFSRVSATKLASETSTLQVVYDNEKPKFEGGFVNQVSLFAVPDGGMRSEQKIGFNDSKFRAAFSTKPVVWSYEKEWRYVEETGGLFPWPGPITTVVFGLKMPNERRKRYANLLSENVSNAVELFEIAISSDNSNLVMNHWSP